MVARLFGFGFKRGNCTMEIGGNFNAWDIFRFGFGYINTIQKQHAVATSQNRPVASNDRDELVHTMRNVIRMRKALEAIRPILLKPAEISIASPASTISASNLGLDSGTYTTVQSTEEVNTTPTSYSTFAPGWTGSTAQATISGEYDGSSGTGTLRFDVTRGGTHGSDFLQIKVYDPNGNQIDQINIKARDAIDKQYALSNGLTITLGSGDLFEGDSFTVDVDASVPTSFSPVAPSWQGSNLSAAVTVDGAYDGSQGSGDLSFVVEQGGIHGSDNIIIKAYAPDGSFLEDINIGANDPLDTQYTLSNGIRLTFGDGEFFNADTFSLTVSDSIPSAVDPDKPFNGTGVDNPNLETGFSVTDGSFEINGVTIDVNASDTINTVLDRINQSGAGVTATFDTATEKVVLTQNTPGATQDIVLGNDTSGFLAAVKLDGAVAFAGESASEMPLAEVENLASIQSGSFSVNGVSIAIDVNTDSLTDVLDRITASAADVTASFDSTTQLVSLVSDNTNNELVLDSGTTNFFPALEISDGTYNAENDQIQASGVSIAEISSRLVESVIADTADTGDQEFKAKEVNAADAEMLGTLVHVIADSMNALFDDAVFRSSPSNMLEGFRNEIKSAVSATFDSEGPQFNTDIGIHFDFQDKSEGVFKFSHTDQRRLANALTTPEGWASVQNMFFGNESNGLLNRLHDILSAAESRLAGEIGSNSIFLDTLA
jgi:hypothetical protein